MFRVTQTSRVASEKPTPELTLASWSSAAVQLHQTDHSSILQHFRLVKVGRADKAAMRLASSNGCFLELVKTIPTSDDERTSEYLNLRRFQLKLEK